MTALEESNGCACSIIKVRTLLTHSHRMSIYAGVEWGELYDLGDDPHECVNRWDDPDARPWRRSSPSISSGA